MALDLRTLLTQRISVDEECAQVFGWAIQERHAGECLERQGTKVQQERGWKLFLLLPRMLLHRPPRGGLTSKSKLSERFDKCARGKWIQRIRVSSQCDEQAAVGHGRKGRQGNDLERRPIRALNFVQVGELSSARQGLEGAETAPGNDDTLNQLSDTSKRPDRLPGPQKVMEHVLRVG